MLSLFLAQPATGQTIMTGFGFVPITSCRVVDTRSAAGPFGGPAIAGFSSRDFLVPSGACQTPATAQAYALNVTVVPHGRLGFLTLWPTGQPRPSTSTLNSLDGRITANTAVIQAGAGGGVSVFATDTTDIIIDIDGYFVPDTTPGALAFYPIAPCRIMDTRAGSGPLAGPFIAAAQPRTVPVLASGCGIAATAGAYSLNFTAVPHTALGFLTAWPTGSAQPVASILNAPTGTITANASVLRAGTGGSIDVFTTSDTDLVVDINGYFDLPNAGGLSYYPVTPCRVADTRTAAGPFGGPSIFGSSSRDFFIPSASCGIPAAAQAYALNLTAVPQGRLGFMSVWATGQPQPLVSTLNSLDGRITANAAIVPAGAGGGVSLFATETANAIFDINGYFAVSNPGGGQAALPGIQTGPAPWAPELSFLPQRVQIDGLPLPSAGGNAYHIHQHLDIFVNGAPVPVPAFIGIIQTTGYFAPIHTHDTTGIIHVESDMVRSFTLGEIFDVWGLRFDSQCIGAYCAAGPQSLKVYVNGALISYNPRNLILASHQEIAVVFGTDQQTPNPIPSTYNFGPGL